MTDPHPLGLGYINAAVGLDLRLFRPDPIAQARGTAGAASLAD
jgi:hypothetical protein